MILVSGCTTTPRTCQISDLYRDDGDGSRLAARVEKESVQQFHYSLFPISYLLFWYPPLCLGDEWNIRHKEFLVYRRGDGGEVVREEREVLIQADDSLFMWPATAEMIRQQDVIYRYVMTRVDDAREYAQGREAKGAASADIADVCERYAKTVAVKRPVGGGESALAAADGEALVRTLSRLPYRVERAKLPMVQSSSTTTFTSFQSTGAGGYRLTTVTVTTSSSMPLINPESDFRVRVVRRFTAAKSGKLLGTVDDTYELRSDKENGDCVCQTLLK